MEYFNGGLLLDEIVQKGTFSEKEASQIIQQIVYAVAYCHSKGVVHGDLKPENIMIDTNAYNIVKIIDFGTAVKYGKMTKELLELKLKNNHFYIAPEMSSKHQDERCDVWSIGIIMYLLLTGTIPYEGDSEDSLVFEKQEDDDRYLAIKFNKFNLKSEEWTHLSDSAKKLMEKMMSPDIEKRPYAKDLLNDDWFSNAPNKPINKAALKKYMDNMMTLNATKML